MIDAYARQNCFGCDFIAVIAATTAFLQNVIDSYFGISEPDPPYFITTGHFQQRITYYLLSFDDSFVDVVELFTTVKNSLYSSATANGECQFGREECVDESFPLMYETDGSSYSSTVEFGESKADAIDRSVKVAEFSYCFTHYYSSDY